MAKSGLQWLSACWLIRSLAPSLCLFPPQFESMVLLLCTLNAIVGCLLSVYIYTIVNGTLLVHSSRNRLYFILFRTQYNNDGYVYAGRLQLETGSEWQASRRKYTQVFASVIPSLQPPSLPPPPRIAMFSVTDLAPSIVHHDVAWNG